MKRPTWHPGLETRHGPLGWVASWVDPWGERRPMTGPCKDEEAALDAAAPNADGGGPLPFARRRTTVRTAGRR